MEGPWRPLSRRERAAVAAIPAMVLMGIAVGESGLPWPSGVAAFAVLIAALGAYALTDRWQASPYLWLAYGFVSLVAVGLVAWVLYLLAVGLKG
jgi:hypothetical protein